jgi:hypothetical protein
MLPDYPRIEAKVTKWFVQQIKAVDALHMGAFNTAATSIMQEGRRSILTRGDGTTQEMASKHIESKTILPLDLKKPEMLTIGDIRKAIWEIGRSMAMQKKQVILDTVDQEITKAGNVVGPGDRLEQFFKMIEIRAFDFDASGQPLWGELILGSQKLFDEFDAIRKRIETTPELSKRLAAIIEQKRSDFLDREAARKLAE